MSMNTNMILRFRNKIRHLNTYLLYKGCHLQRKIKLNRKYCSKLLRFLQFWQVVPLNKHGHWQYGTLLDDNLHMPPFWQLKLQVLIAKWNELYRVFVFFSAYFSSYNNLPWPQQDPVNPGGHWQECEHVFVLAMQLPLFKQGLELHGLVSLS